MTQLRTTSTARRSDAHQRWLRWSLAMLVLAGGAWWATTAEASEFVGAAATACSADGVKGQPL